METPTDLAELGFRPDPTISEPIYLQLATALSTAIRSGRIAVGARLPSERLYAEALGVSRTTITAAYQQSLGRNSRRDLRNAFGRPASVMVPASSHSATAGCIRASRLAPLWQPARPKSCKTRMPSRAQLRCWGSHHCMTH
jgi:DNA-binding transcriptional MocR family regulator